MRQIWRRRAISTLFSVLLGVLLLEGALQLDPLGVMRYARTIQWIQSNSEPHPTGYRHPTGAYDTPMGEVTILADGTRALPTATDADCTLAFVGDSITFGFGVSDDEVYTHHVAEARPSIQFVNTARMDYNTTNLTRSVAHYDADAYLYLIVANDAFPPSEGYETPGQVPSATRMHIEYYNYRQIGLSSSNWDAYEETLDTLQQAPVVFVGLQGDEAAIFAEAYGVDVQWIPTYTELLSWADPHPSAASHRQIAQDILPIVDATATQYCAAGEQG